MHVERDWSRILISCLLLLTFRLRGPNQTPFCRIQAHWKMMIWIVQENVKGAFPQAPQGEQLSLCLQSPLFYFLMVMTMNFLSWNIRGAAAKGVPLLIKDLVSRHNISCMALFETKVSGSRALSIVNKLGFDGYHVEDAVGFSGGIWIMWDSSVLNVQIL